MRVARIFNTFGPRMHMYDGELRSMIVCVCVCGGGACVCGVGWGCVCDATSVGRVVSNFIIQALLGKPLTVSGRFSHFS